jgi:hypothetical protein
MTTHDPQFTSKLWAGAPGHGGFIIWHVACCDEKSWGGSYKSAKAWYTRHLKREMERTLRERKLARG